MKRLIDEDSLEGTDEQLAGLFRASAPFDVDPFRKRRVLVTVERLQTRGAHFWLRPVVRPVIIAALLVSGTATAALGHRYVTHGTGFFGFGPPEASPSVGPASPKVGRKQALAAPARLASTDSPNVPVSSAEPVETASEPSDSVRTPRPVKSSTRTRTDSGEDATHVVEAIQALRTDRDPSRAQALLSDYLKSHPHGVLSEDALALSIEAASAQHDPRAADYARRYLATFPRGRYRALANRALDKQR